MLGWFLGTTIGAAVVQILKYAMPYFLTATLSWMVTSIGCNKLHQVRRNVAIKYADWQAWRKCKAECDCPGEWFAEQPPESDCWYFPLLDFGVVESKDATQL